MPLFGPDPTYAAIRRRVVPGTAPEAAPPAPAPVAQGGGLWVLAEVRRHNQAARDAEAHRAAQYRGHPQSSGPLLDPPLPYDSLAGTPGMRTRHHRR